MELGLEPRVHLKNKGMRITSKGAGDTHTSCAASGKGARVSQELLCPCLGLPVSKARYGGSCCPTTGLRTTFQLAPASSQPLPTMAAPRGRGGLCL